MSGKDFQKTHEELTECKKELSESNEKEDEYVSMLKELNNLGGSISQELKDTNRVAKKIYKEVNQSDMEFNLTQLMGKVSVRPLADLKEAATEVFADVKDNNVDEFSEKDINCEEYYQEKENLEHTCASSQKFFKFLKSASEGLHDIVDAANNRENQCNSYTSSLSNNDTDPSTVNFSLFENSATRAPTSSPLEKLLE